MRKKLILVASPPAGGKTYVSEIIAESADHIVYLDKDDLSDLIRASFVASGEDVDMDGEFYINNLRAAEYSTILNIAFSALRFEEMVLLNAPFLKEVRDTEYMQILKDRANKMGAQLWLIWVTAPVELCRNRMRIRNSDRDTLKLKNWEDYVNKTDFTPPIELEANGAVDRLIIFDNSNESNKQSIKKVLKATLGGEQCLTEK